MMNQPKPTVIVVNAEQNAPSRPYSNPYLTIGKFTLDRRSVLYNATLYLVISLGIQSVSWFHNDFAARMVATVFAQIPSMMAIGHIIGEYVNYKYRV